VQVLLSLDPLKIKDYSLFVDNHAMPLISVALSGIDPHIMTLQPPAISELGADRYGDGTASLH